MYRNTEIEKPQSFIHRDFSLKVYNLAKTQQMSKNTLECDLWDRVPQNYEKTRGQKSHATVPLMSMSMLMYDTVQYGTVWNGMEWNGTIHYVMV